MFRPVKFEELVEEGATLNDEDAPRRSRMRRRARIIGSSAEPQADEEVKAAGNIDLALTSGEWEDEDEDLAGARVYKAPSSSIKIHPTQSINGFGVSIFKRLRDHGPLENQPPALPLRDILKRLR
ncbi:hypothetical protein E2P81_ATG01530 [Venturia nashicola]|nr:hypothetical protein E2P81_ATG01530 [Venturia nashicola]